MSFDPFDSVPRQFRSLHLGKVHMPMPPLEPKKETVPAKRLQRMAPIKRKSLKELEEEYTGWKCI